MVGGATVAVLIATLLLVRLTRLLRRNGAPPHVADAAHAVRIANESVAGFAGVTADVDRSGYGAIVHDDAGGAVIIRVHGGIFVARRLDSGFFGRLDRNTLMIESSERAFGSVVLDFGTRAGVVARRLNGIL